VGVDASDNLYVGLNLKPRDRPYPKAFMDQVPARAWLWWRSTGVWGHSMPRDTPWLHIFCNPYLFQWGSVFKFGPEGGAVYGHPPPRREGSSPYNAVENAPPDAADFAPPYLGKRPMKVAGAAWSYLGCSPIPGSSDGPRPDPGCVCLPSHLAVDLWGRVYAPDAFSFSIRMLDAAGNRVAGIGDYDNADYAGPEIAFAGPVACDFAEADGRLYVSDMSNRRVAVIRFDWSAAAECRVP
jgi:hypothetical protein